MVATRRALRYSGSDEGDGSMSAPAAVDRPRARPAAETSDASLRRIQELFELTRTDLGSMFGASRQAVSSWLSRGVPPARKPKVYTVLNIAELLERKLKRGRLPAVVRRPAGAYGGRSMIEVIEADRHDELLESVRESFDWSATA